MNTGSHIGFFILCMLARLSYWPCFHFQTLSLPCQTTVSSQIGVRCEGNLKNQHQLATHQPVSSTKISISFQLPPPGSSTKSASASSFHHQAAAPHQPASSKATSQPAVNSTSLPHPHHGSQVCCCLDIL